MSKTTKSPNAKKLQEMSQRNLRSMVLEARDHDLGIEIAILFLRLGKKKPSRVINWTAEYGDRDGIVQMEQEAQEIRRTKILRRGESLEVVTVRRSFWRDFDNFEHVSIW